MPILRMKLILKVSLQDHRDWFFLFGDNELRQGYGGQAAVMRGEPNAIGIITKKFPSMQPAAFYTDTDLMRWEQVNAKAFAKIESHLQHEGFIVIPTAGLGTGRARLFAKAPGIAKTLKTIISKWEEDFPCQ